MTEGHACSDAAFISTIKGFEALPHIVRLLARGDPLRIDELASTARLPHDQVDRMLRSQAGTEFDEEGRLVGFGLSLRPTQHRYTVAGRTLYTWCASDTLLFTVVLGQAAVAESTCPATGGPIRLELSPDAVVSVEPAAAVVSQRQCGELIADLRAEVCDHGHFFASHAAARSWAGQHPDGRLFTVAEAFDHCRQACATLGWVTPEAAAP